MPSSKGLARARALAKTAVKEYAKRKRAAEASVATWHWCSRQVTSHEPGHFEINNFGRGKTLPAKPPDVTYKAQEGFDAAGRLVVTREYTVPIDQVNETFHAHEGDAIVSVRYYGPKNLCSVRLFATDAHGRVTTIDSVSPGSHRTRIYRFDTKGHYAGFDETGEYKGKPVPHAFDFECDAKGRIVRTWWLWPALPGRPPDLYWEHSSVKGKKATKPTSPPKPTKQTAMPPTKTAKPAKPTSPPKPTKQTAMPPTKTAKSAKPATKSAKTASKR